MSEETYQEITLQLPADYVLPHLFSSAAPHDVATILTLGAHGYELLAKEGQKLNHTQLYETLQKQAETEFQPKLEQLMKQVTEYTQTTDLLRKRLQEETQQRQEQERRIRDEERRNREEIVNEKDSRIVALETQIQSSLRAVETSLADKFLTLANSLTKSAASSKTKGDQGEMMFADLLQSTFGSVPHGQSFHIEKTGKEARQGDIHMTWMKHKLMWEIKNYDYTVPTKEVQKFVRDMEEAKDIGLGVMVSLHTSITGHAKAGGIDITELSDGRFCVYISKFLSTEDPTAFLQSIKPFLEVLLEQRTAHETNSTHSDTNDAAKRLLERFEEHRQIVVRLLKDHEEKTKAFRNVIMNAKRKSEGIWTEIMAEIAKAESSVALVLTTLLAAPKLEDEVDAAAEDQALELPSFVFRNTDFIFYNAAQTKFIRDVLERFTIETDAKVTIGKKDLKESLKDAGYTDDSASKFFEQVLLEDVWDKGKQKVRYFKKRVD